MKMIRTLREWGSLVDPQYVMSQCGAQKMLIDGYSFVYHRVSGPRTFWRCDWCQKSKCRCTVATEAGQTYLKNVPHNHPRSKNLSVANRLYSHLKTAVNAFDEEPIPDIVKRVMEENAGQSTNETMPSFDTMCRSMTRYRSRMRTFQRRTIPEASSSSQPALHKQQPLYHQIVSTSGYGVSMLEDDLSRSLPQPSWNSTIEATIENVLGMGVGAEQHQDMHFPPIVATDNVKEEMNEHSPVMEGLSLMTEVRSELFDPARQEAKREDEAVTSEMWCNGLDSSNGSLIKRVIEGYKQLCYVRKTAESSVSHASIIAMFSNGNEPESLQSQKMKAAKYAELQMYRQIEIPFLVDFVTKVFTEIGHLPSPSKVSLFREFVPYLWLAEMGYLSQNAFSADPNSDKLLVSMWQYIDEASLNNFFEASDETTQRMLKELLLDKQLECVVKPMNQTGFTESEFAILLVWLLTESGSDTEMKETLASIRESTLCAADVYYQSNNLGSCAVRISSLVSIACNIKILRERLRDAMTGMPFVNVFEAQAFL